MKSLVSILFLFLLNQAKYLQSDIVPPVLENFTFDPQTINVSDSAFDIRINLHVTDNFSGSRDPIIAFTSPSGTDRSNNAYLISGTVTNGIFEGFVSIPQYSEAGVWEVGYVYLADSLNNWIKYTTSDLINLGYPTILNVESTKSDIIAPTLNSFDFAPKTIDVSNGPDTVMAYIGATDNFIGTKFVDFDFVSPSGVKVFAAGSSLIEGTDMNGVYLSQVIIPQYSEAGVWEVGFVFLIDSLDNWIKYTASDLINLGYPNILNVESATLDTIAPVLHNFTFFPNKVDVIDSSVTVTISLHVTDDITGCNDPYVKFRSPSGKTEAGSASLISGQPIDGIFEGTVTIPQYSESGEWVVDLIWISDNLTNFIYYYTSDLANSNFPTILTVSSTLTNIIDEDLSFQLMLKQNYPNPFNPITKISYSIPKTNYVTIKVFNLLGKEIATLVNEKKTTGNYEVEFDGSNFASGVYLYRMHTGNFFETKKLILIK